MRSGISVEALCWDILSGQDHKGDGRPCVVALCPRPFVNGAFIKTASLFFIVGVFPACACPMPTGKGAEAFAEGSEIG
ncbi:hypothetical protein GXY_01761 [Novacetimonas hansenii ATCC 23769]|uniref:Uncharacterized protein n=1 Tax=Novacetimonas hansenii ATCC 23769 TaxID=714995 RepID=D5QB61_NOVHA|nr:hypothetical protein GXY_01761 [Novacetimonas hansenii ATCC 23769]